MPLIEPLETRETYKIRDFVIVLDTSYSVSGELVEHFFTGDLYDSRGVGQLFCQE